MDQHSEEFQTVAAAKGAGFVEMQPSYYGGEQIAVQGRRLIRGPRMALSQAEWQTLGRQISPGQEPHAIFFEEDLYWPVYRHDQVTEAAFDPAPPQWFQVRLERQEMRLYLKYRELTIQAASAEEAEQIALDYADDPDWDDLWIDEEEVERGCDETEVADVSMIDPDEAADISPSGHCS